MNTIVKSNEFYLSLSILLGDGWIDNGKIGKIKSYHSKRANLVCAHKYIYEDYLQFKKQLLESVGFKVTLGDKRKSDGINQRYIRTWSSEIVASVRDSSIINKQKIFKKEWTNILDELSLAILWMDDGSLVHEIRKRKGINNHSECYYHHYGEIATHNFDLQSNENIQYWLKNNFNIETRIMTKRYRNKPNKYYLRINKTNTKHLTSIVTPFVKKVPSMHYKIIFKDFIN